GVELTRACGRGYQPTSKDGFFVFPTDTSTMPRSAQIGVGFLDPSTTNDARTMIDGWLVGGYVQDEWRPLSALILTAGVRYDAEIGTLNQGETEQWESETVLQRGVGEDVRNLGAGDTD